MVVAAGIAFLAIVALLVYTAARFWRRRWNAPGTMTVDRDEEGKSSDTDDDRRAA